MRPALLALLLPFALAPSVNAQTSAPFTLEQAMAEPDWIGPPVERAWWTWDGKQVQYELKRDGSSVRVIMGSAYGLQSPVLTYSPTLYFEATLAASAKLAVLDDAAERAVYVVSGNVAIGGEVYGEGTLAVLRAGATVPLEAETEACVIVVGGSSVGPRHIWWNFVSSSEARIERAKQDWAEMRMGTVPGDDEFIPLPSS